MTKTLTSSSRESVLYRILMKKNMPVICFSIAWFLIIIASIAFSVFMSDQIQNNEKNFIIIGFYETIKNPSPDDKNYKQLGVVAKKQETTIVPEGRWVNTANIDEYNLKSILNISKDNRFSYTLAMYYEGLPIASDMVTGNYLNSGKVIELNNLKGNLRLIPESEFLIVNDITNNRLNLISSVNGNNIEFILTE
jgi:hypothetical protein